MEYKQGTVILILSGCSEDLNCPQTCPTVCNGDHRCQQVSYNFISSIIVSTSSCSGCSEDSVEEGLQLELLGRFNTHCSTGRLDNSDLLDYASNQVASFNTTCQSESSEDHGLGQCNNVSE